MEWYFLISLALLPFVFGPDPAPGLRRTRAESRNLICERVTPQTAAQRYPGEIAPARPRGDYVERSVVVCNERVMRPGLRKAQDEAILSSLQELTSGLVATAHAMRPDLADKTWLVETHLTSGPVAAKVAFAVKNDLVLRGLAVSDRTPILGFGDVDVITRLEPEQAYAMACKRYFATGSLGPDHALLAIANLDPRETILHAGICADGRWEWVR